MNENTEIATMLLDVTLQKALETGKIQVRVIDNRDPAQPIQGAQVTAMDGMTTVDEGETDDNGEITLEIDLSTLNLFTPKPIKVVASQDGFTPSEKTVTVIAVATTDVNLVLVPQ
jgi:hypothetical protein